VTADRDLVPGLGGTRRIPAPDGIAADYLLLGLRLDQHIPGLVDSYYGPAELKASADMEQLRPPARLLEDIGRLTDRVEAEVADVDRRTWLLAQLRALDAHTRALAGDPLPYVEYVERTLGFPPRRHAEAEFDHAAAAIDDLLPGDGPIADRLDAWDRAIEIPASAIPAVSEWLLGRFRERARRDFGLPDGEVVRLATARDKPWMAYHRYLGGGRSTVEVNVDLPVSAHDLIITLGHEVYPGHHLEATWRESSLLEGQGRLEVSMILSTTPESPISEGLARYGTRFASPPDERADLLVDLLERAGSPVAADRGAARDLAERTVRLAAPRERLAAATDEAALRLNLDGASRDEVLRYMHEVGRYREALAEKRLAFIDDPLSRLYVFAYETGEALIAAWVETAEAPDQIGRFGRLLHEQVTPGRLLAETG
jgi:hypothetical protein